jgi:L,D-transpeptidase catalytic domain
LISHISSGNNQDWCEIPKDVPWPGQTTTTNAAGRKQRVCGSAVTPGGIYQIYRKEKGEYEIPLGKVFDPLYFNGGVALHGSKEVPNKPASHGCVRLPMHIGTRMNSLLRVNDAVYVFDGVKNPEIYGRQPPPLDTPDPTDTEYTEKTASTTTSSTTTTTIATTTTVATTTTGKPTTTVATTTTAATTPTTATTVAPTTTAAPATTTTTVKP